ncbi:hypothetical protein BBFL7_01784 [Flavobacteria bacterium BBFL7]|nr:hypothetical protein BBFL7_01784 [Flavobacteria bacterium BBFL7]
MLIILTFFAQNISPMFRILSCLILFSFITTAQVGLETENPQAALDITSTDAGLLIPRVELTDSTDILTVTNPDGSALVKSTIVYNTVTNNDVVPAFYYWNGVDKWLRLLVADDNEDIWKANPANGRVEIDKLSDGVTDRPNNNVYITDESQLIIDQVTTNTDNGGSRKIQVYNGDIANYSNIDNGAAFGYLGHKSRGSIATPTTVLPSDHVTAYYSLPYNGTSYALSSYFMQGVDPSWNGTDATIPGNFQFHTTSPGIAGEKMRLTSNGLLGINTPTPAEALEVHGNAGNNWDGDFDIYSYSSNITSFHVRSASGNRFSPGSMSGKTNANIYNMEAQGYNGSSYITASAIRLGVTATTNVTASSMPGRMDFLTTERGTNNLQNRMTIDDNGNIGINTTAALTEKLEVNGTIKATDINFTGLPVFASDADATANASLEVGSVYIVGNTLKIKM